MTSPTPGMRDRSSWMLVASQSDTSTLVLLSVSSIDADDHQQVGRALGDRDALLLDLLRQARDRGLDLVLDLDLRDVRIDALVERPPGSTPGRARSTTS